jgi:hypothetical protein
MGESTGGSGTHIHNAVSPSKFMQAFQSAGHDQVPQDFLAPIELGRADAEVVARVCVTYRPVNEY